MTGVRNEGGVRGVRVPAALHRWAAEHNQHLSPSTRSEVDVIASIIEASSLRDYDAQRLDEAFYAGLRDIFPLERAERAETLIGIVAAWSATLPPETPRTVVAEVRGRPSSVEPAAPVVPGASEVVGMPEPRPQSPEIGAPAFLRSDKVDEDDTARLYGSARSYIRIVLAVLSVLLLAAVGVGVWLWASSRSDEAATTSDAETDTILEATDPTDAVEQPTAVPTVAATPAPTLSAERPSWADTNTILNAGNGTILASTYPVTAANRAVLTGHADAITGIAVSNDGRVLTSGADRRLVDWGADVTLASPDVLEVDAPLTVLARTADQKVIAGDANGNITVIDLINSTEPLAIDVHPSSISAIAEANDGRIVVASVDGDVAVFALQAPGDRLELGHSTEVTALAPLADGTIATAAVDGIVRIWPATGGNPVATIDSLGAPITAMIALLDGRLAIGSVDGTLQVVPAIDGAQASYTVGAHEGAIRSLLEFDDQRAGATIATGSDDTTVRLFSLETGDQWQQLDGHGDLVSALAQLPDGRLVSTSADGTGRVWNLELLTDGGVVRPPHERNLTHLTAWRNDQFISGGSDGLVVLASTTETTSPEQITRHGAPVVGLTVMPNGDIVSLDAASILRLSQIGPDAAEPFEFQLAPGATALDDRGELGVVTGHADGTVRFSDFTAETASIPAHGSGVNDVLGLSSGLVASASEDNTVRIIDPENPDVIPVFDLHTGPVQTLAELPDGRIASAGLDAIFIWSVEDMGQDHIRLTGHQASKLSLLGLPDGRLVSTAVDGRVRVWDLQDPQAEPITLVDIPGIVNPVLAQADNGLYVAGAARGYVIFTIE